MLISPEIRSGVNIFVGGALILMAFRGSFGANGRILAGIGGAMIAANELTRPGAPFSVV